MKYNYSYLIGKTFKTEYGEAIITVLNVKNNIVKYNYFNDVYELSIHDFLNDYQIKRALRLELEQKLNLLIDE